MLRILILGALLSLGLWLGTVTAGVAVAVMSQSNAFELSFLVSAANVAAPFLGGFLAGWMVKKRGWVHGGWVGVLFTVMAALAASAAFQGLFVFSFSTLLLDFCLGCIGGICGVNTGLCFSRGRDRAKKALGL